MFQRQAAFDGGHFGEGFFGGLVVGFGFFGEIGGDEIDDGDRATLMFPPSAGDALFKAGGIPRQVAIDDDAGVLKIESYAAGVGAERQAAVRVIPEGEMEHPLALIGIELAEGTRSMRAEPRF